MPPGGLTLRVIKNNTFFYGSLLLLECFLWGVGNPIIKLMFEDITPFYALTIRFIIASAIFLVLFRRRIVEKFSRKYIVPGLVVGLFTALTFATSNLAIMYTQSTIAGFLMGMAIIFTQPLARLFLGVRINPLQYIPITLVIIGMYYLCGASADFAFGLGEFYAIFCSLSGACMLVASSKYLVEDMDPLIISVMQTVMIAFYCLPAALLLEEAPVLSALPARTWAFILYLAVACSCIAYILQNIALAKVPSTYAALIFCSEPIFTAIASNLMLGETLSRDGYFGGALVMVSIVTSSLIPHESGYRSATMRLVRMRTKRAARGLHKNKKKG